MRKRRRCSEKDECVEAKRYVSICDDADFIFSWQESETALVLITVLRLLDIDVALVAR